MKKCIPHNASKTTCWVKSSNTIDSITVRLGVTEVCCMTLDLVLCRQRISSVSLWMQYISHETHFAIFPSDLGAPLHYLPQSKGHCSPLWVIPQIKFNKGEISGMCFRVIGIIGVRVLTHGSRERLIIANCVLAVYLSCDLLLFSFDCCHFNKGFLDGERNLTLSISTETCPCVVASVLWRFRI